MGVEVETRRKSRLGMQALEPNIAGAILAVGTSLPKRILANSELAAEFNVTEDWIGRRCGIDRRFIAADETATSLGCIAAANALASSNATPDLLLCATYSADRILTPIAPGIASSVGLGPIAAFDINAACCGGLTAFLTALAFISSGLFRRILVVAADTTTKHLAQNDLSTRMLFSDGAAAILVGPPDEDGCTFRLKAHRFGSDGRKIDYFAADWANQQECSRPTVSMDGPAIFRFAVETGIQTLNGLCSDAAIDPTSLNRVIIHQANARILRAIQESVPIPKDRWPGAFQLGNLAGASLLFLLAKEFECGMSKCGNRLALVSFGAGLTWVGAIMEVGSQRRPKAEESKNVVSPDLALPTADLI
jgi:3-oxoacyl-[acyl-carrier-protein] synthase-3